MVKVFCLEVNDRLDLFLMVALVCCLVDYMFGTDQRVGLVCICTKGGGICRCVMALDYHLVWEGCFMLFTGINWNIYHVVGLWQVMDYMNMDVTL